MITKGNISEIFGKQFVVNPKYRKNAVTYTISGFDTQDDGKDINITWERDTDTECKSTTYPVDVVLSNFNGGEWIFGTIEDELLK